MKLTEEYCRRYILALKDEAEQAKKSRMDLNQDNYRMYQLEHDFSHKMKGQSKEVLSKTRNATEQSKAFFQQALADLGDWYRTSTRDGSDGSAMIVRPEEMQKLMNYMLGQADYFSHVGASVQSGLLGSLAISKVHGVTLSKPKFKTKAQGRGKSYKKHVVVSEDKTWELRLSNIRQEDYYPDPTGSDLFRIEEYDVDLHIVKQLAEGDNAIYDKEAVDKLQGWGNADLQQEKKAYETGQDVAAPRMRPQVRITEFWGTVVEENTGDILAENVVITMANHTTIIRKPTPNPLWHQRSPIVAAALIEFANSVWGIALMDAGTKHNRSLIEIFNLMMDAAMKAVWGVNQLRTDVLDDPMQVTDGIRWGTNLKVNSALPPGAKAMEPVVTGEVPSEVLTMFNLLTQETLTSMMTNDLRMGGQSMRAVKATEVVAAENSITSVFQGIAKNFEEKKILPELELACYTICQNWDLIDREVFISLFGTKRGEELSQLEPQEVFVNIVNGLKFEVFGISTTLRKQADFRKWTTFLQTIGASEVMIEAFLQKYSFSKVLGEVMTALDINKTKIENEEQTPSPGLMQQAMPPAPGGPDMMSQIPDAGAQSALSPLAQAFSGVGGQMAMPSSQALR